VNKAAAQLITITTRRRTSTSTHWQFVFCSMLSLQQNPGTNYKSAQ